jgi:SAM-dependent methyltransferase
MTQDDRPTEYLKLHDLMYRDQANTRQSAQRILAVLFEHFRPRSVLDVGCGLGTWLKVAIEMGVGEVLGVEGPWLQPQSAEIDPKLIVTRELEQPFSLGRLFDLVICLEVAEHLSPAAAESFVQTLTSHAPAVLFSAAIPQQGGTHHLNEQLPEYWASLFAKHDYATLDLVRPALWKENRVSWWYRQNVLLFASSQFLKAYPQLRRHDQSIAPLSIVHPAIFGARCAALNRFQNLAAKLSTGGTFTVVSQPDGSLQITKQ